MSTRQFHLLYGLIGLIGALVVGFVLVAVFAVWYIQVQPAPPHKTLAAWGWIFATAWAIIAAILADQLRRTVRVLRDATDALRQAMLGFTIMVAKKRPDGREE